MKGFFVRNSLLLIVFFLFFCTFLFGQTLTGHHVYNEDQKEHGESEISYGEYLTTGHFLEATMENWESEFLQMGSYVLLTVWFRQKGSAESKPLDEEAEQDQDPLEHAKPDSPWPVRKGKGLALSLYKSSLSLAFFALFAATFLLHLVGGAHELSQEQQAHGGSPITPVGVPANRRLLVPVPAELAVGVPGGGGDRVPVDLPAADGKPRVEAGRSTARPDGQLTTRAEPAEPAASADRAMDI